MVIEKRDQLGLALSDGNSTHALADELEYMSMSKEERYERQRKEWERKQRAMGSALFHSSSGNMVQHVRRS